MLNEYMGRYSDGQTIERFYAGEGARTEHFEEVLREFCEEERLVTKYERKVSPEGIVDFGSPSIASAIDKYYRPGHLDEAIFADASDQDLLRYIEGAYRRNGDDKKRAIFCMVNAPWKMRTVGHVLAKLGCTQIRIYDSTDKLVPTSYVLLFSPCPKVKAKLGILSEVGLGEIGRGVDENLTLKEEINAGKGDPTK